MPGRHNVLNALAALAACRAAGVEPAEAGPGARRLQRRRAAASRSTAAPAPARSSTTTTPTTRPRCAPRSRPPARSRPARLVACFQPHLYSRTRLLAREFGRALALADVVVVLDVYPARERAEDFPGVSGLLVAARRRRTPPAGGRSGGCRDADDAARMLAGELREGDLLLTLGAGDVDELARELDGVSAAPEGVERDYPLARLTTIRTGGRGGLLRPPRLEPSGWPSCWPGPTQDGIEVGVVGSGSNLLVADDGFRGLVMKLDGALATIEQDGERLLCGGGARLPQAAGPRRARGPQRPRVRREHPGHASAAP